jgi:3-phosphoshikimate 1-carboxyvinyltransferase
MTAFIVHPMATGATLAGRLALPGDKSVGHRALLFSLLSETPVRVVGLGTGADNGRSARAITQLGARLERDGDAIVITGTGMGGMRAPTADIDCGNSGTTIRLMCGLLAAQRFATTLFGDESLSKRPMRRVIAPLAQMGAHITGVGQGADLVPPLVVGPAPGPLRGLAYELPVSSAQVKSALLLAGLWAEGVTRLTEPGPSRDHTERLLAAMGAPLTVDGRTVTIDPAGWDRRLAIDAITVPGDPSSSAFLIAAALVAGVTPGAEVVCERVCTNPTRTGFLDALAAMGARVVVEGEAVHGGEPVAALAVRAGGGDGLVGTEIGGDLTVRAIDEIPVLAAVAARARGVTVVRDAEELRVKESDRVATTAAMLRGFGVEVEERPDGLAIEGKGGAPLRAASVHAHGDHRIAMAATIAGLVADGPTRIDDADNVATSYPGFVDAMRALGARIDVVP